MFHDISPQMQQVMRALEEQLERDQRSLRSVDSDVARILSLLALSAPPGAFFELGVQRWLLESVVVDGCARGVILTKVDLDEIQGLPVDEFAIVRWKESRPISAGNIGSLALPSQVPHPLAARLFANWLPSQEGQIGFQRVTNTPFNSDESMRIDIPKDMIPADVRRTESVKYFLADKPEFMEVAPIL